MIVSSSWRSKKTRSRCECHPPVGGAKAAMEGQGQRKISPGMIYHPRVTDEGRARGAREVRARGAREVQIGQEKVKMRRS